MGFGELLLEILPGLAVQIWYRAATQILLANSHKFSFSEFTFLTVVFSRQNREFLDSIILYVAKQ